TCTPGLRHAPGKHALIALRSTQVRCTTPWHDNNVRGGEVGCDVPLWREERSERYRKYHEQTTTEKRCSAPTHSGAGSKRAPLMGLFYGSGENYFRVTFAPASSSFFFMFS